MYSFFPVTGYSHFRSPSTSSSCAIGCIPAETGAIEQKNHTWAFYYNFDQYGFEGYYNFAVTPWMKVTPDIQFVRPARRQVIDFSSSIPIIVMDNFSTAAVFGLRLQLIF